MIFLVERYEIRHGLEHRSVERVSPAGIVRAKSKSEAEKKLGLVEREAERGGFLYLRRLLREYEKRPNLKIGYLLSEIKELTGVL